MRVLANCGPFPRDENEGASEARANFKAVMRLFNKFTQGTNESLMDSLYRWMFGQLSINGILRSCWRIT